MYNRCYTRSSLRIVFIASDFEQNLRFCLFSSCVPFFQPFWGLWGEHLKEIEGSFGSAVMITFAFLRWVFLLDVCLAILWTGAVIIPFFLSPPSSFRWTGVKQLFQVGYTFQMTLCCTFFDLNLCINYMHSPLVLYAVICSLTEMWLRHSILKLVLWVLLLELLLFTFVLLTTFRLMV